MSQVAAKKRLVLRDERVRVVAHFKEEDAVLAGTQQGSCEDFDVELSLHGEVPVEELKKLIQLAHQMCFTESALRDVIKITSRHIYNGELLDPS